MIQEVVNGHILPRQLLRMSAEGRREHSWCRADLTNLPIEDRADLDFLSIPEMCRHTEELRAALTRGDGMLFALIEEGPPVPGFLNVSQAVVIAATRGQEALALDYSAGEQPRVVATRYEPRGMRWVEVAPTFDDLLRFVRISGV